MLFFILFVSVFVCVCIICISLQAVVFMDIHINSSQGLFWESTYLLQSTPVMIFDVECFSINLMVFVFWLNIYDVSLLKGRVSIVAKPGQKLEIPDGVVLENKVRH